MYRVHTSNIEMRLKSSLLTMRFAFAKLLASIMLHSEKSIFINVPSLLPFRKKWLFHSRIINISQVWLILKGNSRPRLEF